LPSAKSEESRATYSALKQVQGEGRRSSNQLVPDHPGGQEEPSAAAAAKPSRVNVSFAHRPELDAEAWIDSQAVVINTGHPTFKKSQRNGEAMTTMHIMRCVFMALMENRDPSKKEGLDELRKFYKSWAVLKN
jgi:hypothetical protein